MSYRDREDHAKQTGETLRTIRAMVRRLAIKLTEGTLWQLIGQRGGAGGDEVVHLETFPGIGFYARPASSGKPEAIAVAIAGAAKARVVIATRDEQAKQAAIAALQNGELAEGETLVYTPTGIIHMRANGTVEIRSPGGTASPLATKADVDAIRNALDGHSHKYIPPGSGGGTPIATTDNPSVPAPVGTSVLKAQ